MACAGGRRGWWRPDDVEVVDAPVPEPSEGEALVRTDAIGVDAAVRTWLDDQPGYLPPVQLGEVVRAGTVGEVIASRCPAYEVGDVVTTLGGFAQHSIVRDDFFTAVVGGVADGTADVDRDAMLAVFGSTGATAYFGLHDGAPPGNPPVPTGPRYMETQCSLYSQYGP